MFCIKYRACVKQVMVPLTSKAFMRGHLVHTNELLVLLGDNWFMEASAKRAAEVASRRLRECDNILEKVGDCTVVKNSNHSIFN